MFFNYIKEFILKKIVKKKLHLEKTTIVDSKINTVGIVLDEKYFTISNQLIKELERIGINREQIEIVGFKNVIKKQETFDFPVLCYKNVTLNGVLNHTQIESFINLPFDLLINFYDVEKAPLILTTFYSKAKFKVGLGAVDKRLNHFIIDLETVDYKIFFKELFKYLKILNKL